MHNNIGSVLHVFHFKISREIIFFQVAFAKYKIENKFKQIFLFFKAYFLRFKQQKYVSGNGSYIFGLILKIS